MPTADLERIFGKFYRSRRAIRCAPAQGLGLAISHAASSRLWAAQ